MRKSRAPGGLVATPEGSPISFKDRFVLTDHPGCPTEGSQCGHFTAGAHSPKLAVSDHSTIARDENGPGAPTGGVALSLVAGFIDPHDPLRRAEVPVIGDHLSVIGKGGGETDIDHFDLVGEVAVARVSVRSPRVAHESSGSVLDLDCYRLRSLNR